MLDQSLLLFSALILMLACLGLILLLVMILTKSYKEQAKLPLMLLNQQLAENQKLRNIMVSPDVPTLMGMNQATGVAPKSPQSDEPFSSTEDLLGTLPEAISYEEELARKGYEPGELGHDLESAGWNPVPSRRNGDDPIAYDPS